MATSAIIPVTGKTQPVQQLPKIMPAQAAGAAQEAAATRQAQVPSPVTNTLGQRLGTIISTTA